VDLNEIDPIFYDSTYLVAPGKGGDRPYALLREVMEEAGRVAVCSYVMHGKQHLALVRPFEGRLALELLYYPDEIRDGEGIPKPSSRSSTEKEKEIARQLVDALTTPWKPADFKDTYREAVLAMIAAKAKGDVLAPVSTAVEPTKTRDLMAALEASLAERTKTKATSHEAQTTEASGDSGTKGVARNKTKSKTLETTMPSGKRRQTTTKAPPRSNQSVKSKRTKRQSVV
jgi:DNA end-binding protein Ku